MQSIAEIIVHTYIDFNPYSRGKLSNIVKCLLLRSFVPSQDFRSIGTLDAHASRVQMTRKLGARMASSEYR